MPERPSSKPDEIKTPQSVSDEVGLDKDLPCKASEEIKVISEENRVSYENEKNKINSTLSKFANVENIVYKNSEKFSTEKWAEDLYEIPLKIAFEQNADIVVFIGKSARGHGLLVSKMIESARLVYAMQNGVDLKTLKLPRVCFVDDKTGSDFEKFKKLFLGKDEKVVFYDESSSSRPLNTSAYSSLWKRTGIDNSQLEEKQLDNIVVTLGQSSTAGGPEISLINTEDIGFNYRALFYNISEKNRMLFYERADNLIEAEINQLLQKVRYPFQDKFVKKEDLKYKDEHYLFDEEAKYVDGKYEYYKYPPEPARIFLELYKNAADKKLETVRLDFCGLDKIYGKMKKIQALPFKEWEEAIPEISLLIQDTIQQLKIPPEQVNELNNPYLEALRNLKNYLEGVSEKIRKLASYGVERDIDDLASLRKQVRLEHGKIALQFLERHS